MVDLLRGHGRCWVPLRCGQCMHSDRFGPAVPEPAIPLLLWSSLLNYRSLWINPNFEDPRLSNVINTLPLCRWTAIVVCLKKKLKMSVSCRCKYSLMQKVVFFPDVRACVMYSIMASLASISHRFSARCFIYWSRCCSKHIRGYFVTRRSILYCKWLQKINIPRVPPHDVCMGFFSLLLGLDLGAWGLKNPIHEVTSREHEGLPGARVTPVVWILITSTPETWHKLPDSYSLQMANISVPPSRLRLPELCSLLCSHSWALTGSQGRMISNLHVQTQSWGTISVTLHRTAFCHFSCN